VSKFLEQLGKVNKPTLLEEIKAKLDKESFEDFVKIVEGETISIPSILKTLNAFDIKTSKSVLQRWRVTKKPPSGLQGKRKEISNE